MKQTRRNAKLAERKPMNSARSGTIEGADWDLEIGGVADIVNERGSSPAVLFDSVKGYPKGYRVLVNSLGSTKRLGLSLGMPQNLNAMEFVSEWRRRSKDLKHIPPRRGDAMGRCWKIFSAARMSIFSLSRRRAGSSSTAAGISVPAASISPTIRRKAGPISARRG